MSRNVLLTAALLAIGGLIAVGAMNLVRPADAQSTVVVPAFTVTGAGNSYVLCESASGRTWVLFPKADDQRCAWMPVKRLDTDADVRKWKVSKGADEKDEPGGALPSKSMPQTK